MKTFLLSAAIVLATLSANSQFSQDFEGTESQLSGNCWIMVGVYKTTTPADVITGTGSMYTNPPTSGSSTRDITSPALNVVSPIFTVSFKYKVSSAINGNATRTIEVGVLDAWGVFTSLQIITMDRFSPTTVQTFNQTFILASTGLKRLVLKLGGATGDGNSRLIFDDLWANANPRYGTGTCNSAPIAVNDVFNAVTGSMITGNIMSNDNEPDGELMTPTIITNTTSGIVTLDVLGNLIFTPNEGFTGSTVTFTYNLVDQGVTPMTSNTATVTINYFATSTLPVKFLSFNAVLNNNKADLEWVTASEMNLSHFVIEKSQDGLNYTDAATVFAYGNTTAAATYNFADNIGTQASGLVYYRLRAVDQDGSNNYSIIRVIRLDKKAGQSVTILSFPNPVTNELKVTIPANWQNKRVVYELLDLNGRVTIKQVNKSSSQTEAVDVSRLQTGMYIVRVSCEGQIAQQKIIRN